MTEHKITVKDLDTSYKVFGAGKPLLILHGWQSNSERWQKVAELLGNKFLVIVPDLPGFGKTQQPLTSWSLDNYVEWIREFADKVPELNNNFYLLGHSFGGALAAKFAIKYVQRAEKLFLVSAACVRKYAFIKKVAYRIAKIVKAFSFIPGYLLFRKAVYKFIIRKSDYIYQQDGIMKETYLRGITEDLSQKICFVKVPTIVIWGDKDSSTPLHQGELISKKIPHAQMAVISGADHSLHIKAPEALAQKILEHLST